MRFKRFAIIVVVVTLLAGGFGAAIGALMGYGTTGPLEIKYDRGSEVESTSGDESVKSKGDLQAGIGNPGGKRASDRAAALGGAFGLLIGAGLGIAIGMLDQFLGALRKTTSGSSLPASL